MHVWAIGAQEWIGTMATTYATHYSRYAGDWAIYDPTAASMGVAGQARLRPACRIRGRKDVSADWSRVTCMRCLKDRPVEAPAAVDNVPVEAPTRTASQQAAWERVMGDASTVAAQRAAYAPIEAPAPRGEDGEIDPDIFPSAPLMPRHIDAHGSLLMARAGVTAVVRNWLTEASELAPVRMGDGFWHPRTADDTIYMREGL